MSRPQTNPENGQSGRRPPRLWTVAGTVVALAFVLFATAAIGQRLVLPLTGFSPLTWRLVDPDSRIGLAHDLLANRLAPGMTGPELHSLIGSPDDSGSALPQDADAQPGQEPDRLDFWTGRSAAGMVLTLIRGDAQAVRYEHWFVGVAPEGAQDSGYFFNLIDTDRSEWTS